MVIVVGFGNALLDYIVHIESTKILNKHNLNEDDSKEIGCADLVKLLEDVREKYTWVCSSGGSAQNTLCLMKWILKDDHSMMMFGAVGNDSNGQLLKQSLTIAGVDAKYMTVEEQTGLIISLVYQQHRSMVGNIGASAMYRKVHAMEYRETLKSADITYMEGFFLNHDDDEQTSEYIIDNCKQLHKPFAFNLCAVYICEKLSDKVRYFVEHCDILFGNAREFTALAKSIGAQTDIRQFAVSMCLAHHNKIIVVTNGCNPVFCTYGNGLTEEMIVPEMQEVDIVDTTGAGDAFVAGFLSGHVLGWPIPYCLRAGCWASKQIIKQNGCKPPNTPSAEFYSILV